MKIFFKNLRGGMKKDGIGSAIPSLTLAVIEKSVAQAKTLNKGLIAGEALLPEILEEFAAFPDHYEESSA